MLSLLRIEPDQRPTAAECLRSSLFNVSNEDLHGFPCLDSINGTGLKAIRASPVFTSRRATISGSLDRHVLDNGLEPFDQSQASGCAQTQSLEDTGTSFSEPALEDVPDFGFNKHVSRPVCKSMDFNDRLLRGMSEGQGSARSTQAAANNSGDVVMQDAPALDSIKEAEDRHDATPCRAIDAKTVNEGSVVKLQSSESHARAGQPSLEYFVLRGERIAYHPLRRIVNLSQILKANGSRNGHLQRRKDVRSLLKNPHRKRGSQKVRGLYVTYGDAMRVCALLRIDTRMFPAILREAV